MALWFNLSINDERLGTVEIRRLEVLDLSDPAAIAGVWSTYDVRRDGVLVGQVRHVYGHGAWKLLALAANLIGGETAPQACQAETCSWDHFTPEQMDPYWIRCTLQGPHDRHEDEHTGLTWVDHAVPNTAPHSSEADRG